MCGGEVAGFQPAIDVARQHAPRGSYGGEHQGCCVEEAFCGACEALGDRQHRIGVDRARSRETGGTGLGLAIVRHVAHNHGGEVSVRSKEGQGSEFTLVLPLGTDVVEPESPVDDSEVSA